MSSKKRVPLADRVTRAAEAALAEQKFAPVRSMTCSALAGSTPTLRDWQQGRVDCLEEVLQVNSVRFTRA